MTDPQPLGESLDRLLRSMESGRAASGDGRTTSAGAAAVGGVFGKWVEIVGEPLARHVEPVRLDGERLVVEVTEPSWATQIRVLSGRLCERIAEVAGVVVSEVEVRVRTPRRR